MSLAKNLSTILLSPSCPTPRPRRMCPLVLTLAMLSGLVAAAMPAAADTPAEQWWTTEKRWPPAKLTIPPLTASESKAQFEERRQRLLSGWAVPDMSWSRFGEAAIANLSLNQLADESNRKIREVAQRDSGGEVDFVALYLTRAYYLFHGGHGMTDDTEQQVRSFFLTRHFKSNWCEEAGNASENHEFVFHTARFLMAQAMPKETFTAYGKTGTELVQEDRNWLLSFLRFRGRRGWGEFDSAVYYGVDIDCLACLYDFSRDADLKRLSGMKMDLMLADVAINSIGGMFCGAHGRIYYWDALKHSTEDTYGLQYLYFGSVDGRTIGGRRASVHTLTSTYRPDKLVVEIALNRREPYENLERAQLHKPDDVMPREPLAGSIRKYTYWTPDFVMGCVQFQDDYPETYPGRWYAHHEQHEWDLTFPTRLSARIFTQHPGASGDEHGYWTGDMGCGCGHFFQNKGALVALYDIGPKEKYQWIHAFVPRNAFDEVVEENGFIFVREGDACAALKLLRGYEWTTQGAWSGAEVISHGARNGVVCEAGRLADYGGFKAFRQEIADNKIVFDQEKGQLTYDSKRAGKLFLGIKDGRKLNDQPVDLDYPTFGSPFMSSRWDSGIVEIRAGGKKRVLDFTK